MPLKRFGNFNATGLILIPLLLISLMGESQNFIGGGEVHGNFQMDAQFYRNDTAIGAPEIEEKMLMNGFLNVLYSNGPLTAGIRYEGYLNPILGFDPRYEGQGIPYRFISFKKDNFELTAGNFYEQFGNGLVLRSYEEWNLGYDNSIDGFRVVYAPTEGILLKGVIGKQRYFWNKGPGTVRGIDVDFSINEIISSLSEKKTRLSVGGSFVSKYQPDEDIMIDATHKLVLPLNVGTWAMRFNLINGGLNFSGEYAYKFNDPSAVNDYIYKNGQSILLNASYSRKGLGISFNAKYIDNESFKSKRTETSSALDINFLPPLTDQHSYGLASTYPYATQPNGEVGFHGQVTYTIPKKSTLGGKYGTTINVLYSTTSDISRTAINDTIPIGESGTLGYNSTLFGIGDEKFYDEFNLVITHKFSKKFKAVFFYLYQMYNIAVIEGHMGDPDVYANTIVADMSYRIKPKHSLRMELQYLTTKQDDGDWAMALLEYNIAPKWFFAVFDQYNFGNPDPDKRFHFYNVACGFNKGSSRLALSYGRQREGILCVGGVCRNVPASNGLTLTLSSSF